MCWRKKRGRWWHRPTPLICDGPRETAGSRTMVEARYHRGLWCASKGGQPVTKGMQPAPLRHSVAATGPVPATKGALTRTLSLQVPGSKVPQECVRRPEEPPAERRDRPARRSFTRTPVGLQRRCYRTLRAKSRGRQARISGLLAPIWHTKKPRLEVQTREWDNLVVDEMGFEPTTPALRTPCSPS